MHVSLGPTGFPTGKVSSAQMSQKKTCPFCHQQLSWHALSRHIRDMHKNKSGFVNCRVCGKLFRNKNSLGCHMWRFHKDSKGSRAAASASAGEDNASMMKEEGEDGGQSPVPPLVPAAAASPSLQQQQQQQHPEEPASA